MDSEKEKKIRTNPREKANILSLLTFWYSIPIFRKGLRTRLDNEDLYEVIDYCKSKPCGDKADIEWHQSLSIYQLLWRRFGRRYVSLAVINLAWGQINSVLQPYGLSRLISYFDKTQTEITKTDAYYSAAIVVVLTVTTFLFIHNFRLIELNFVVKIQTSLKSLLYRKVLRLSPESLSRANLGNIVTILTKDISTLEGGCWVVMDIINETAKTLTVSYLLWKTLGNSAFIGLGLVFLALPVQTYLSTFLTKMRLEVGRKADERLQVMQETLSAIKIIKMYTWESFFERRIALARSKELVMLMRASYLAIVITAIGVVTSKMTFLILILSYTWLGGVTTTEMLFYTFSLFNQIIGSLSVLIPANICSIARFRASFIRINNFLQSEEIIVKENDTENDNENDNNLVDDKPKENDLVLRNCRHNNDMFVNPSLHFQNVSVTVEAKHILADININIETPGLRIVSGAIGSGKSSFLKAILKETPIHKGYIDVNGTLSYASQEPWLFPSSIRKNVLLGEKYQEARYQEVIRVCALDYDLSLLDNGDKTILSDRGVNLSKGQQLRINLARAIYRDSDIYLLDDPLTSLDSSVQDFIFTEAILGLLGNKICILVTQNISYFRRAEQIILMEDGEVISCGKFEDVSNSMKQLQISNSDFNKFEDNKKGKTLYFNSTEHSDGRVYQEVKKEGKVDLEVYKTYMKFGGGFCVALFIILLYILAQICECAFDIYMTEWIDLQQEVIILGKNSTTHETYFEETVVKRNITLSLYAISVIMHTLLSLAKTYALLRFCRTASVNIHHAMSFRIISAPMSFFDTHYIGNIINRFSHDLSVIDEAFPIDFPNLIEISFACVGEIIVITTVNWIFLIPSTIFLMAMIWLRAMYIQTGRAVKRLEAAAKSPLVGHINSTLEGLLTIRACGAQQELKKEFDKHQDNYTSAQITDLYTRIAFGFYMDVLSFLFTISIISRFLFFEHDFSAGNVGLALTQVFILTSGIRMAVNAWATVENEMTSTERALEYTAVKREEDSGRKVENWPREGAVLYQNVTLKYEKCKEPILKGISFSVKSGEKIGVVGRTGAGKSSVMSTLFRLYYYEGKIIIDDVDITTVSLTYLRQNLTIIPQDPILFTGTIRDNIDANRQHQDGAIWKVLDQVKVSSLFPSLDMEVENDGLQFSVGQKQLICLARAIIDKRKIVVLDEATANLDTKTDKILHEVIDDTFDNCTMFIIAHRLHSVLKCDKVMVLDNGRIMEFDDPKILLQNEDSYFYQMNKAAEL